jgi:hypothetical protein
MGQQPNIELEISDLPRPTPHPAPARGWTPRRPGELNSPAEVPWGGAFGTTGPDTGYALKLVRAMDVPLAPGEHRRNVDAAVAAVAGARASHYGRAPTRKDVEVALTILGYRPKGLPEDLIEGLARDRVAWFANLAHQPTKAQELVAAIPVAVLESVPEELLMRMGAGERLIDA